MNLLALEMLLKVPDVQECDARGDAMKNPCPVPKNYFTVLPFHSYLPNLPSKPDTTV